MIEIISQDKEVFLYLNNLGSTEYDSLWKIISGKFSWIPLYACLLYLLYKNYCPKQLLYILLFLVLGMVASDQLSNVFKYGFERLRPCHDPTLTPYMRVVECGGKFGFYSAHASNTFLLASFLSPLLKKKYGFLPAVLFVWATIVAYSRIYLGVHFPLDILMGASMGMLIGSIAVYLAQRMIKNKE